MTRRTIESRLDALESDDESEIPEHWKIGTPRELWHSEKETWEWGLTEGESHPELEPPESLEGIDLEAIDDERIREYVSLSPHLDNSILEEYDL